MRGESARNVFSETANVDSINTKTLIRNDGKKLIIQYDLNAALPAHKNFEKEIQMYDYRNDKWEVKPLRNGVLFKNLYTDFYEILNQSILYRQKVTFKIGPYDKHKREQLLSLGYIG